MYFKVRDEDFDTCSSIVEVICEDKENYQKIPLILDDAVAEFTLGGVIHKGLRSTIPGHLSVIQGWKMLMLKKFSKILQNTYHRNPSGPPEIVKNNDVMAPAMAYLRSISQSHICYQDYKRRCAVLLT